MHNFIYIEIYRISNHAEFTANRTCTIPIFDVTVTLREGEKIMNSYIKALLEEAYDVALDHKQLKIAEKIAELFNIEYCDSEDEQTDCEHLRAIDHVIL